MSSKNATFVAFAVAAITFQQGHFQVSGAAIRGLSKNQLFKGSRSSSSSKSSKKGSKHSSSSDDSSALCSLEVVGFDPYRKHMKYSKDVEFFVKLSGVPNSRRTRQGATNKSKTSLQIGLVEHFRKASFQREIDDSDILKSFVFDPTVDIEILGAGYSRHADDEDDNSRMSFPPPLFSGTIKYVCADSYYKDDYEEQLFWELAQILDNRISSSETPLYEQFSKDFENSDWKFDDLRLMVAMA